MAVLQRGEAAAGVAAGGGLPFLLVTEGERGGAVGVHHRRQRGERCPAGEVAAGFGEDGSGEEGLGANGPGGVEVLQGVRARGDGVSWQAGEGVGGGAVGDGAAEEFDEVAQAVFVGISIGAGDERIGEGSGVEVTVEPGSEGDRNDERARRAGPLGDAGVSSRLAGGVR